MSALPSSPCLFFLLALVRSLKQRLREENACLWFENRASNVEQLRGLAFAHCVYVDNSRNFAHLFLFNFLLPHKQVNPCAAPMFPLFFYHLPRTLFAHFPRACCFFGARDISPNMPTCPTFTRSLSLSLFSYVFVATLFNPLPLAFSFCSFDPGTSLFFVIDDASSH